MADNSAVLGFESFCDDFMTTNDCGTEESYSYMNKVIHPKHAKVREWLSHSDRPFTHMSASSSQRYSTNRLTCDGYTRNNYYQQSKDLGYNYPGNLWFEPEKPPKSTSSQKKKHHPDAANQEGEEEDEREDLVGKLKKLDISKHSARHRRSSAMECRDASETKQGRGPGGIRKNYC
ncbi:hypothetical protein ABW20_dc0100953 [Dactylellina cionopaga]|nr:hypothetical protein ABW20_dc0100953 [Dactylellina cionopaga]